MAIFSSFVCGGLRLLYEQADGVFGFRLFPADVPEPESGAVPESMIQFKLAGTPFGADPGAAMRNAPCLRALRFRSQETAADRIITRFEYGQGLRFDHVAEQHDGWVRVWTEIRNETAEPVEFEYLAGFSVDGISPHRKNCGTESFFIERINAQGHHEELSAENAGLEITGNLRFGQNSTLPVTRYCPFAGVENRTRGILWGAQLESLGAWQLEVSRNQGMLSISGGMPDRESGGGYFRLEAGENCRTDSAVLTCIRGDILDLFNRLHGSRRTGHAAVSPLYCGEFSGDTLRQAQRLGLRGYVAESGLSGTEAEQIRQAGLIPGVTLELETRTPESENLLRRNGIPVQTGKYCFADFSDAAYRTAFLSRLAGELSEKQIGYLRLHCPAGFSAEAAELTRWSRTVRSFHEELRRIMPGLEIEMSAPHGGRFSAGWMCLADSGSCSEVIPDAEIPMTALDRQMLEPGHKCQVRAEIRAEDTPEAIRGKLNAGLLGRLCLAGPLAALSAEQIQLMTHGLDFYRTAEPVLRDGTFRLGHIIGDRRSDPSGWQVFYKENRDFQLVVLHTFRDSPAELDFGLQEGTELFRDFCSPALDWKIADGKLRFSGLTDFVSAAFLFRKSGSA